MLTNVNDLCQIVFWDSGFQWLVFDIQVHKWAMPRWNVTQSGMKWYMKCVSLVKYWSCVVYWQKVLILLQRMLGYCSYKILHPGLYWLWQTETLTHCVSDLQTSEILFSVIHSTEKRQYMHTILRFHCWHFIDCNVFQLWVGWGEW